MKSKKLKLHLPRVFVLIILVCISVTTISLSAGSQAQLKEYHTDEVLHVIDGWLNKFESVDKNNRNSKIDTYNVLSEYQLQLSNHVLQCERIDSEFDVALSHITDWFFINYLTMVDDVIEVASGNIGEIKSYLSDLSADIDELTEMFYSVGNKPEEEPEEEQEEEPADEPDEKQEDNRLYKLEFFTALIDLYLTFIEDDFISLKLDENEEQMEELTDIISLIEGEGIIDSERITVLDGKINSFIETYSDTDQIIADEVTAILYKFDTELLSQEIWFENHYLQLIGEITDMEREDEFDEETVKNQIEKLELVKLFIEDDGVVGPDFLLLVYEQIDRLIEEYEEELIQIAERIEQRDAELAAAAAATAAANNRNTTTAASNNRSGSGSGNTGSSSTSGSGSSSSSGSSGSSSSGNNTQTNTGNRTNTGSTPVSGGNNNYPSITSNCREILARLVKLEAPNEIADGKQAVAEVVLNRMVSSRWNHVTTVEGVVFDDKWGVQFTVKDLIWTERGTPSSADYAAVDRALSGPNVLTKDYMFFTSRPRTQDVLWIGNHAFSK